VKKKEDERKEEGRWKKEKERREKKYGRAD
jgi:hypothetical protein